MNEQKPTEDQLVEMYTQYVYRNHQNALPYHRYGKWLEEYWPRANMENRKEAPVIAAEMKPVYGFMVGLTTKDWLYIHVFTGHTTWAWGLREFWHIERTNWGRI